MSESDDHLVHHRKLRERRAIHTSLAGIAFQGVYALGQFVVMALLFRYLTPQRFGMWLTIYSLTAWVAFTKFGLQYALYTSLGHSVLTDHETARRVLTNAAAFVAMTGTLLTLLLVVVGPYVPWQVILNVKDADAAVDINTVCVVALAVTAMATPMMMGGHALQAAQRGWVSHLVGLVVQLLMMATVTVGVSRDWSLSWLAAIIVCPPLVSGVVQWCYGLFMRVLPCPTRAALDATVMRRLLAAGFLFVWLDVATVTLLQSGPLIVSQLHGPEAVVPYGAAYRLVGLMFVVFMVVCYAYWPAYSEASRRADSAWIVRGLMRSLLIVLGIWLSGTVVILAIGRPFIDWWLGAEAVPSWGTLWAAVFSGLTYGLYVAVSTPLSGMGRLRPQLITAALVVGIYAISGVIGCAWYGAAGLFFGLAVATAAGAVINAMFLRSALGRTPAASAADHDRVG